MVPAPDPGLFQIALQGNGSVEWIRHSDVGGSVYHHGMAAHTGEGYLVLGTAFSGVFGACETNETSLSAAGDQAGFVVRYTRDGRFAWLHQIQGERVWTRGLAAGPNGSYLASGVSQGVTTYAAGEPGASSAGAVGQTHNYLLKFEAE